MKTSSIALGSCALTLGLVVGGCDRSDGATQFDGAGLADGPSASGGGALGGGGGATGTGGSGTGGVTGTGGAGSGGTTFTTDGGSNGHGGTTAVSGSGGRIGAGGTAGAGGSETFFPGSGGMGMGGNSSTGGARTGGAMGTGGAGTGGTGVACGGTGNLPCALGSYCDFSDNRCGTGLPGTCTPINTAACSGVSIPVCGCDGMTYAFTCDAMRSNVDVSITANCPAPAGTFRCGWIYCQHGTQYCTATVGGFVGNPGSYTCLALPATCATTLGCPCLGAVANCTENGSGDPTVTQYVP